MAGAAATLWMGDLDHYMDEVFVSRAFLHLGENIQNVKLIRKKVTGLPAGYGFIDFPDPESAHKAMLRLNGKPIPGTKPTRKSLNKLVECLRFNQLIAADYKPSTEIRQYIDSNGNSSI